MRLGRNKNPVAHVYNLKLNENLMNCNIMIYFEHIVNDTIYFYYD